jgi:hypothetical protein
LLKATCRLLLALPLPLPLPDVRMLRSIMRQHAALEAFLGRASSSSPATPSLTGLRSTVRRCSTTLLLGFDALDAPKLSGAAIPHARPGMVRIPGRQFAIEWTSLAV